MLGLKLLGGKVLRHKPKKKREKEKHKKMNV